MKWAVTHVQLSRGLLEDRLASDSNDETRSFVSTSRAIDIVRGGSKANALPEYVTAVINHRIGVDSSVAELEDFTEEGLKSIARLRSLNISVVTASRGIKSWSADSDAKGHLKIESRKGYIEPSPVSPVVSPV